MISRGNHVKFALFVFLAVGDEANTCLHYFFHLMYNKTIIRFGFCNIQNNQGLDKVYQLKAKATSTRIILHITKTSSNTCFSDDVLFIDII